MQFHNEVRPVCTATAAQLWLLFASYVSFNPLMFSLFLFYSLLYYFLSVFWACSFFLLSACFFGEETFRTLAGNQGWPFCSLLRPVRSKAAARCFRLCGPRACPHRRALENLSGSPQTQGANTCMLGAETCLRGAPISLGHLLVLQLHGEKHSW